MELEIYWTDFTKLELREIFEYYKEEANLRVAKNLVKGIVQSTLRLSTQPYIGGKEPLFGR